MKATPEWGEGETRSLRILWDEGLTTAEIGQRLGRTSNSIVGKAHRLHLTARPSPIKRDGSAPKRPYIRRVVVRLGPSTLAPLLSLLDDPILLTTPKRERPARKPKPVAEAPRAARKHQCLWLDGDNPFIRCTATAEFGKSYCAAHHKIAYRRLVDLRDEAIA